MISVLVHLEDRSCEREGVHKREKVGRGRKSIKEKKIGRGREFIKEKLGGGGGSS